VISIKLLLNLDKLSIHVELHARNSVAVFTCSTPYLIAFLGKLSTLNPFSRPMSATLIR
jgi:hypothetical protein